MIASGDTAGARALVDEALAADRHPELLASVSTQAGRVVEDGPPALYSTLEGKRRREKEYASSRSRPRSTRSGEAGRSGFPAGRCPVSA